MRSRPTSGEPTGSGSSGATPESPAYAELLIDCEVDRTLRAVLVGMLRGVARARAARRDGDRRPTRPRVCGRAELPEISVTRVSPNVLPVAWTEREGRTFMSPHKPDAEAVAEWMLSDRGPLVRGSASLHGDTALQRNAQLMVGTRPFSRGSERTIGRVT
jgi:hypothetical protein